MKLVIVVLRGYCMFNSEIIQRRVISSSPCDMLHPTEYCHG
jgi:hypothetical protein